MTIDDSYGGHHVDTTLKAYEKWLYRLAYDFTHDETRVDDLVQEGRIAMWRALETWVPERVALPTWLTGAARMRMKDLAWGHGQPTGHEEMRGRKQVDETSLDAIVEVQEGGEDSLDWLAIDALSDVEIAYHHGEIERAMDSLSPTQREYVFLRFWGNLDPASRHPHTKALMAQYPVMKKRWLWSGSARQVGAKQMLAEALGHLVDA